MQENKDKKKMTSIQCHRTLGHPSMATIRATAKKLGIKILNNER